MSASHSHQHQVAPARGEAVRLDSIRRMQAALALNLMMVGAAVVGAIITNSLALFADAGHVLSDVLAIGLGLGAALLAARPASGRGTFGHGRWEILAALFNSLALFVVGGLVVWGAFIRLSDPPDVAGMGVALFGVIGFVGNAVAVWILHRGESEDINLRAVLIHTATDMLASLAVVVAGVGIALTGWLYLDPIISLLIAALIIGSAPALVFESVGTLLERAPRGLDVEEVGHAVAGVEGVYEVHDLHVWSITTGFPAFAAHVVLERGSEPELVRGEIETVLLERFGISHTTIQTMRQQLLQVEQNVDRARPSDDSADGR